MAYRVIQVGCGGFGRAWCSRFLPPNVADGRIEVVAAVDVNADALANAREHLGLPPERCYTELDRALDENPADICTVVVPPARHEEIVDAGLARGLNILSEKPIADTLEASCRIAEKVGRAGVKMGVTMSHRFRQDITTLREEIRGGRHGDLDYLVCRFTCDRRHRGTWGEFRYDIADPLLIEGSVHHLDLLADLAGAPCRMLWAQTWNPAWSDFAGDAQALVYMQTENGRRITYEGAKCNAVGLNGWGGEYIRAECERATLILAHGAIECFAHDPAEQRKDMRPGDGVPIPLIEQPKWANAWLIEQFCDWLDGGDPMPTHIEANLQSMALIAAAIQASRTGWPQKVQDLLTKTRKAAAS